MRGRLAARVLDESGCAQFDEQSLAEIESEDFPGERLICCRNPLVAAERSGKREDMLRATERALSGIERRVEQGTLSGRDQIGLAAVTGGDRGGQPGQPEEADLVLPR
jgi:hypothetical protein